MYAELFPRLRIGKQQYASQFHFSHVLQLADASSCKLCKLYFVTLAIVIQCFVGTAMHRIALLFQAQLIALFCSQVEACHVADYNKAAVKHALLDKVRAFSSTPEAAVSFFTAILHPSPTKRLTSIQALQHPYLRCCVQQMQASYSASQQSKLGAALVTPVSPPVEEHARTHSSFLSKIMSVPSSGVKTLKSLVGRALAGNNSSSKACILNPARYFPDYVHASSDAELSAHLPLVHTTGESQADHIGQLLAGINQVRTDFSLTAAFAHPPTPIPVMLQAPPPIKHVMTSADTDSAAAALQLQRQLYPASPLSAATPQRLPHDEQLQLGSEERRDGQDAGFGLIPAIHSSHAQPATPREGLSDAASAKQHSETPAHQAAADRHMPRDNDPHSGQQPGSTQASHSIQRLVQAQQASADQHAPAGSHGMPQWPHPGSEAEEEGHEEGLQSAQVAFLPAADQQVQVMEPTHPESIDVCMMAADAKQLNRLYVAGGAGDEGSKVSGGAHESTPTGQLAGPKALFSHPMGILSETEEDLGGAQPSQPVETLGQAHPHPHNQHSSTPEHAEITAVAACEKPLKSHALVFCSVEDQDLDVVDTRAEERTGTDGKSTDTGIENGDNAARGLSSESPYLSCDVPAAQTRHSSNALYRSVAAAPSRHHPVLTVPTGSLYDSWHPLLASVAQQGRPHTTLFE